MSPPKYSTGGSDADQWTSDKRVVLREWTTKPYNSHRHRHKEVEHRIVVEYHHGVGLDVVHEARSDDDERYGDEWEPVETVEARDGFARHDRRPHAGWLE